MRFSLPFRSNASLLHKLEGHSRLNPAWAILPSQTGEQPEGEFFLREMEVAGIKALWAFPGEHQYSLNKLTFPTLLARLAERKIPLFVRDTVANITRLVAEFPELIVIAAGGLGPGSLERSLRPILDSYPNLHLETSSYIVDGLIEEFCERYGADRLLFGSGYPDNCSGGAALLRLMQADIDQTSKEAIAGGNLKRILGGEVQL